MALAANTASDVQRKYNRKQTPLWNKVAQVLPASDGSRSVSFIMKVSILLFSFVLTPFTLGTYVFPDVPLFHKAPHAGRGFHDLNKRQVDACGPGDTCVEACGAGWAQCGDGTYCYNRAGGEKCCGFMSKWAVQTCLSLIVPST